MTIMSDVSRCRGKVKQLFTGVRVTTTYSYRRKICTAITVVAIRHLHRIPHFSPVGVGGNGWNPELLWNPQLCLPRRRVGAAGQLTLELQPR